MKKIDETMIKKGLKCPKCGKRTVERHIVRELQQSRKGQWFIEFCTNPKCDYYYAGFT